MFSEYVDADTFNLRELSDNLFRELFTAGEIDGYKRYKDSDVDAMSAWEYWDDNDLLHVCLEDLFDFLGYVEWDDKPSDGRFIWIQDYEMLVVQPNDTELLIDVATAFDRDSLYETQYAEGIVRDGVFYATTIARELD